MTLRKQIKYNAKRCLCNNWGKAMAIVLLSCAIYLLFIIIEMIANMLLKVPVGTASLIQGVSDTWLLSFGLSVVMSIGSFILLIPLELGITLWYYSLSDGNSEDILNIFCCFANRRMFFRSLWLAINVGVRVLLSSVLYLIVPTAGLVLGGQILRYGTFSGAAFVGSLALVLSGALFILMLLFLLIRVQKYFLAKYYLLDGKTTVGKAIRASIHATRGLHDEIFVFQLSFIGWWISSVLILPMLYSSAYYSMSAMLYARFLIEQDRRANSLVPVETPEEMEQTRSFDPQTSDEE